MEHVKFFLASSIEELTLDRVYLGDFFNSLNNIFIKEGIFFELIKCEYTSDGKITKGGKQEYYDQQIKESAFSIFLFFKKVGDYTKHEFEIALEQWEKTNSPKIITYVKQVEDDKEAEASILSFFKNMALEKHYYECYKNVETLKYKILLQIENMRINGFVTDVSDGQIRFGGQPFVDTKDIPIFGLNQNLNQLKKKKETLQEALCKDRARFFKSGSDQDGAAFCQTSKELEEVNAQISVMEEKILTLSGNIAEITAAGKVITNRQKEAMRYFDEGNYDAAIDVLRDVSRETELDQGIRMAKEGKNRIQGYVEEELLLIEGLKTKLITHELADEIITHYQNCYRLAENYDLDKSFYLSFGEFLYEQNDLDEAEKLLSEALAVLRAKKQHTSDVARVLADLGELASRNNKNDEAEDYYNQAIDIVEELMDENPVLYGKDYATVCNRVGRFYRKNNRLAKAEKLYKKSYKIFSQLANRSARYEPSLAEISNSLGVLYCVKKEYRESQKYFAIALEITARLAENSPVKYQTELASIYNNIGYLSNEKKEPSSAEENYLKAYEVYSEAAKNNPSAYTHCLARVCNNLAELYIAQGAFTKAEEQLVKSLGLYKRIAGSDPVTSETGLANVCNALGRFYYTQKRYDQSQKYLEQAYEIMARCVKDSPSSNQVAFASILNNLGNLFTYKQEYEQAAVYYKKALEIRTFLVKENPSAYRADLAQSNKHLGELYLLGNEPKLAKEYLKTAVDLYAEVAKKQPGLYAREYKEVVSLLKNLQK